ncbi:16S rRNA m(5)C-967 methyltransferase [Paraperlucidibaca baekdonensis]|uniref:16S rRNA (cytosine(967)-C(5))-methyltransferase n=1 Tax=Paraperlucidibaca baekdonensis TaxID=748120 RepID=A0A3E0H8Q3_9GAMM|nr:16S rRNA (cytosine(967)-C(5))-methyltransferase RsmB [Paraperlucidibaca baekdonensis]REH40098.1 16S rRNA m(5)C-967 methyltransferase [Paraperlucidibaca baekdonensis]
MSSLSAKTHTSVRRGANAKRPLGVRALAAQALAPALAGERSLSATLPSAQKACRGEDVGLLQELVQGTARFAIYYRTLIKPLLQRATKDHQVEALLLLGAHQLLAMRIPDHAALAETVEAARQLGMDKLTGFINGVLRNLQRREAELVHAATVQRHAHPAWLLRAIEADWPAEAKDIIEANNSAAPICLRVNRLQHTRSDLLVELIEDGLPLEPTRFSPDGLRLIEPLPIHHLPALASGALSVQDEAAQLAAHLLNPQAGERVLDACAAPGGKTAHLLELMPSMATLVAIDNDAERLRRVQENIDRATLACADPLPVAIETICADADDISHWWDGTPFDAILLDAPCTATGVIRRHPDIKLLRRATDVAQTTAQQARLLNMLWKTLRPGGRLLYATCSLLKAENEDQIVSFLARTPDAQPVPLKKSGEMPGQWRPQGRQLLPEIDGHDGFYYAMLMKV